MPVVGIWAATVTDLSDWNGNTYGKLTVDGTSAVIEFYDNTTTNTNFNTEPITQVMKNLTEVKVKGTIPNSVKDFFNVNQHGHGFSKCQRMDFSEATENIPTDISQHENVTSVILPSTATFSSVNTGSNVEYIIKADSGESQNNAVKVWVKNDSENDWANDPYVQAADYVKAYTDNSESESSYLGGDVITTMQATKWVNGSGKEYLPADFTLDADGKDAAAEKEALNTFLSDYRIKKCTISGELDDLYLLSSTKVQSLDLSGVTNSDITGLKLPTIDDDSQNILLPNGITFTPAGALSSTTSTTLTNLDAAMKALKEKGKDVSSAGFPQGSTYSDGVLTVTNAEKDALEDLMKILKHGDLDVNKITLGGDEVYNNGVLTLTDASSAEDLCEIISGNDLSITKIVFPNGSVWENGKLTVSIDDNTPEGLIAIRNLLEKAGKTLGDITFPTVDNDPNKATTYSGGMLNVCNKDKEENIVEGTDTRLKVIHDNLTALGLPIETVRFENGSRWNAPDVVTFKQDNGPGAANEQTKITACLESAGFSVENTKTSQIPDLEYTVEEKDGKTTVTIKSYKAGVLNEILSAKDEGPEDGLQRQMFAYAQQMKTAISDLENYTLVLEGPYKQDDLQKFTQNVNKKASTVDMRNTTFTNVSDAKFTYWDNNYLRTAYISKDSKLTDVDDKMFQNMGNIEKVVFPNQLESIGKDAFLNHQNLKTLEFEETCHITYIGTDAFNNCGIEGDFAIPNSVKIIDERAFKSCRNITSLIINEDSQLEEIRDQAFRMDGAQESVQLKNVYVYAEKEIECATNAWEFYMTDGQTDMATVTTRLHYPPSMYYWYVGDWKSQVNGGRIEGHDDLLRLRNSVDSGVSEWAHYDENNNYVTEYVTVTPKAGIGWQKFVSTGIPVTADYKWRTYSDVAHIKVPADNDDPTKKIADVYVVCGYVPPTDSEDAKAILYRMKPGDIIPAGTGVVIRHYVTSNAGGALLVFPHVTHEEETAAKNADPNALKPYRFVINGDSRATLNEEYPTYTGIETHDYRRGGTEEAVHNYLEAINTTKPRAIYNAENDNIVDYETLLMARGKNTVTYRNFFFGNGQKLWETYKARLAANGNDEEKANTIGSNKLIGDDFGEGNKTRGWGFFRCISDYYTISSKAFLHLPGTISSSDNISMNATNEQNVQVSSKDMNMILIGLDETFRTEMGITTGVKDVQPVKQLNDNAYYTLQGVKVSRPSQHGIYIHNGKKVVVK